MGISAKYINTMKNLYTHAKARIRVANLFTEEVSISKGVMQGDSISTVLFILFLNDIKEYLENHGLRGVNINPTQNIISLLYCDDLILFADSKAELQKMLNSLEKYCEENKMIVNEKKTKIVIFRRGGRIKDSDVLYYKHKKLEIVSTFNYLGVSFSSHAVFHQAAEQANSKGRAAIASVKRTMSASQMKSWDSRKKLLEACVKTTLLYGAEIWAFRYVDNIEKCQSFLFKTLYCLPRNTPNYTIRLEMGVVKLSHSVFLQMLRWWMKLLMMAQDRYPKLCYLELCALDQRSCNIEKYNWATQLKRQLVELGFAQVWESQDASVVKSNMEDILEKLKENLINADIERCRNSTYSTLYRDLKPLDNIPSVSPYLQLSLPMDTCRVLAQIRLGSNQAVRIYTKGITYTWDTEET
ncbi:uncharacterized protein LOC103522856, partial [Diaphorina citri]|uniref:Uncharacterized protein LOC103522856 n=1 Tax=Diaphorina citri TaxID=121845 RepID=A0A1S3DS19_DIACI